MNVLYVWKSKADLTNLNGISTSFSVFSSKSLIVLNIAKILLLDKSKIFKFYFSTYCNNEQLCSYYPD